MAYTPVALTAEQAAALEVTRIGLMAACPFYAHYFYSEMVEVFTTDVPTAATDGRRIFINPDYICPLSVQERVFAYAHEIDHVISRHPQRMKSYALGNGLGDKPWDQRQFNVAADYCINAGLLETGVGRMNPDWCYADDVDGSQLTEDVYARKWKKPPETYGRSKAGAKVGAGKGTGSPTATDDVLPPEVDPVTGQEDLPSDGEFKEAVARAAAAAKAMGKLPAGLAARVDEILQPQVDWTEHVRMLLTGRMGSRRETWDRPNRRRLALNPIIVMPGRRGYGAELVVVALDTSGSIYAAPRALAAFFAEVGGVLDDVRPRRVILIECDAKVQRVQEAGSIGELEHARTQGVKGGGGTRFEPVFEHLAAENLVPETLVYLTDLQGSFPDEAPGYPVVWCSIEKGTAPFGDVVTIEV